MREFFAYFFGKGETTEFRNFSFAHILPILILGGIIALLIIYREKIRDFKHEDKLRFTMAFICIISEMSYYWRLVGVEALTPNAVDHLPITVCGWAIIFSSFLVLTKNQTLFDIAYFWCLAGSIFGLATPTVIEFCGPTRFRYYQFWFEHSMGFIVIFYMIFVHKMRPNVKSIFKSYGLLAILAAVAIVANNILPGANYLFMARPESTPSILDILPKNYAVRILIMTLAISILFFLAYLPWMIKDIKIKKQAHILATPSENTPLESKEVKDKQSKTKHKTTQRKTTEPTTTNSNKQSKQNNTTNKITAKKTNPRTTKK